MVTNEIHLGVDYELTFFWRGRWSYAYNFTGVYISTGSDDPTANPGDFTLLEEFSPENYTDTWLQWNKASFDLSSYDNQNIYVAFKYVGDFAHDFFIDNVKVGPMPYCEVPENIRVSFRENDYIDVQWDNSGAYSYEVVWGAQGFDPNNASNSAIVNGSTTYRITGITETESYEIYVRSVCSDYNLSSWGGPAYSVPPAENSSCETAQQLLVYNTCTPTIGTNYGATGSSVGDPGCANYSGGDIWYSVQVPTAGHIIIETSQVNGSNVTDTGMAVYSGSCDSLSLIQCNDDGGSGFLSMVELFNLTPGETLYVRVWEYGNNSVGEIGICAHEPTVSVDENQIEGLKFYPNPVSNTLNIQAKQDIQTVTIFNISGQKVLEVYPNATDNQIDMRHLSNGMYFVKLQVNGQLSAFKVVKK